MNLKHVETSNARKFKHNAKNTLIMNIFTSARKNTRMALLSINLEMSSVLQGKANVIIFLEALENDFFKFPNLKNEALYE